MGETIIFILQRFYYVLGSGFIINLYVLCTFFALRKAEFWFFPSLSLKSIESSTVIWIFICSALIIGVFIEGLTHVCTQYCKENYRKISKQNKKLNLKTKILFQFVKPNTGEACKYYWKQERDKGINFQNSHFRFMYDPITHERYNEDEVYEKMRINALKIATKWENSDIYRYRELSHMSRAMNVSFLLILFLSVLVTVYIGIWCNNSWKTIGLFYLVCAFVSLLFVKLTGLMAWGFSKKHVCNVGELYEALGLHEEATKANRPAASPDVAGA